MAAPGGVAAEELRPTLVGKNGWLFPAWEDVRENSMPDVRRATALFSEALALMTRAGLRVCVALVPMRARLYPEFLPDDWRVSADAEARYRVVLEGFRATGAVVPDLHAVLARQKAQQAEPLFFRADTHWRPSAAYVVAEEVARAGAGLPPASRPGIRLGPWGTLRNNENNLAAELPPEQRRRYPTQEYRVRSVPPAGGGLLDGDAVADTTIVGDSYVLPGYGFTPGLSNALRRPVSLFYRWGNHGHWRRLTDYLGGDLFKARRPALLVIQMQEGNMTRMPDLRGYFGENSMSPQAFIAAVRGALNG